MKMIIRKQCVICGGNLRERYTFYDFPIYMGVTSDAIESDISSDMVFSECLDCNCVQLGSLIPLDIL